MGSGRLPNASACGALSIPGNAGHRSLAKGVEQIENLCGSSPLVTSCGKHDDRLSCQGSPTGWALFLSVWKKACEVPDGQRRRLWPSRRRSDAGAQALVDKATIDEEVRNAAAARSRESYLSRLGIQRGSQRATRNRSKGQTGHNLTGHKALPSPLDEELADMCDSASLVSFSSTWLDWQQIPPVPTSFHSVPECQSQLPMPEDQEEPVRRCISSPCVSRHASLGESRTATILEPHLEKSQGDPEDPSGSFISSSTTQPPVGSVSVAMRSNFRTHFLRKLSYNRVWVPQARQPPRHGTSIIFDWDDTLLCTSFLTSSPQALSGRSKEILGCIAQAGRRVLEEAQQLGQVFIVTNAMSDWVADSARKWLPELVPVLEGIQVISAREKYEARYPRTIGEWKLQTFMEVQRRLGSEAVTNFVSVGDSIFELEAATAIGKMFPQAIIKTVKFREEPSPKELLRELELMGSQLREIVASGTCVRVAIESRGRRP